MKDETYYGLYWNGNKVLESQKSARVRFFLELENASCAGAIFHATPFSFLRELRSEKPKDLFQCTHCV